MLSHPIAHTPIPKFIQDYPSSLISKPKVTSSSSFYTDFVNTSPADSPTATADEDTIPSPLSPQASGNYDYAPRNSNSFDSQLSSADIYRNPQNQPFAINHYPSTRDSVQQSYNNINTSAPARESPSMNSYLSESPSPTALPHSIPPQSQEKFPHSDAGPYSAAEDRVSPGPERLPRNQDFDKYPDDNTLHNHLLDHRRMSEPAVLNAPNIYAMPNPDVSASSRYQHFNFAFNPPTQHPPRSAAASLYLSPLQRGASTGSLRDLRDQHFEYSTHQSEWKHRETHDSFDHQSDTLDEPISPMQSNFSGGLGSSPTTGVPYSPISDNPYGPSPPGTGTSTSSSAPLSAGIPCSPRSIPQHLQRSLSNNGDSIDRKTYSFVALPGNAVKKRPRRRYDEIERLYQCSWPDCNKSYGTLNHLNAHVTMQKHGSKRSPNEFKELRKQWRKAKKDSEAVGGITRRDSYSDAYDDSGYCDQRYLNSHSIHHRPHSSHHPSLPSSVSIPYSGTTDRYSVSIDDIRYPAHDRDDDHDLISYGSLATRQRYSGSLPSSWHGGSHISSRPSIQQQYLASSLPNQPSHHSQLPQLSINSRLHQSSSDTLPLNRLPQNSTLLTPLPGYQTTSLIPISGNGLSYEVYDDDSNSRPGTGHASIGANSGDEFDN